MKPKKGIFRKVLWRFRLVKRGDLLALADQLKAQQQVGRHLSQSLTAMRDECDDVFTPLVEKAMKMHVKGGAKEDMHLEIEVNKRFVEKVLTGRDPMRVAVNLSHSAARQMANVLMKELVGLIKKRNSDRITEQKKDDKKSCYPVKKND